MGKETKIDWCTSTWNPITGCLRGCDYCYARKQAHRFAGYPAEGKNHELASRMLVSKRYDDGGWSKEHVCAYPYDFDPTFHRYRLGIPTKWEDPRVIFVCSMADLFGEWVPDEWIEDVFTACKAAPQHKYLFLTKNPQRYRDLAKAGKLPDKPNFWYGSTVERYPEGDSQNCWDAIFCPGYGEGCDRAHTFVSIEPIMGDFREQGITNNVEWVIVGAETGNRAGKVIPQRKWIENITTLCEIAETPLFMKESLREIMGDDFIQQFPWDAQALAPADANTLAYADNPTV